MWATLPSSWKRWLKRNIHRPSETHAWELVRNHPDLSQFWRETPNPYAIGPGTILYLWRLLNESSPKRILEFGGGTSTLLSCLYASRMAAQGQEVRILSVDHEQHWLNDTRTQVAAAGLEEYVDFVHAPLSEQVLLGRRMVAYAVPTDVLDECAGASGFDLCFIDGPPGKVGRSGSLAVAAQHLGTGCRILLDDAYRDGEQRVLREWRQNFPRQLTGEKLLLLDSHGVATMTWRPPVASYPRSTTHSSA